MRGVDPKVIFACAFVRLQDKYGYPKSEIGRVHTDRSLFEHTNTVPLSRERYASKIRNE